MEDLDPAATSRRRRREPTKVDPDDVEAAKNKALSLLTHRPRGSAELSKKLSGAGFSAEAAEDAVARLTEVGLVDDGDLVNRWVGEQLASGRGKNSIRQKLSSRGLWGAEAAQILESHCDPTSELERATELAEKRFSRLEGDHRTVYGKLTRFLAQRGFSSGVVFEAASRAMKGHESLSPEPD